MAHGGDMAAANASLVAQLRADLADREAQIEVKDNQIEAMHNALESCECGSGRAGPDAGWQGDF